MKPTKALHRFAVLTAFSTLVLICAGGLVTSKEAGMSVPDWPNSYGYNMFFFPISKWVGNIFYEHTHRLLGSWVGLLTLILAVWLQLKEDRRWVKVMGWVALAGVIVQGVLGGLRVTMMKNELGIFHAALAQSFFVLVCLITLVTSGRWKGWTPSGRLVGELGYLKTFYLGLVVLIFTQLVVAAMMRHQHAGLAISDFPLAHGKIWPDTSPEAIAGYNRGRMEVHGYQAITAFGVILQMVHRLMAVIILILGCLGAWFSRQLIRESRVLWGLSVGLVSLLCGQAGLGIATVLSGKSADIATAHVAMGALCLANSGLLVFLHWLWPAKAGLKSANGMGRNAFAAGPSLISHAK